MRAKNSDPAVGKTSSAALEYLLEPYEVIEARLGQLDILGDPCRRLASLAGASADPAEEDRSAVLRDARAHADGGCPFCLVGIALLSDPDEAALSPAQQSEIQASLGPVWERTRSASLRRVAAVQRFDSMVEAIAAEAVAAREQERTAEESRAGKGLMERLESMVLHVLGSDGLWTRMSSFRFDREILTGQPLVAGLTLGGDSPGAEPSSSDEPSFSVTVGERSELEVEIIAPPTDEQRGVWRLRVHRRDDAEHPVDVDVRTPDAPIQASGTLGPGETWEHPVTPPGTTGHEMVCSWTEGGEDLATRKTIVVELPWRVARSEED